jgi:protein-S-isoprenylcysteine O-methyltransferase Ste14
MSLETIEAIVRWLGGILAYITLWVIFYGIWRGTQRQAGRTTGQMGHFLRSPWFYLISSAVYFGICYLGWIPLPLAISPRVRAWMLIFGSLLYFPGMGFALWGRLALGKNYFVSTGLGAQLFADHHLVTSGPYAFVRHPMYLGLILAACGSLLIYTTWTTLLFTCFAPLLIFRTRREDAALASEFGERWQEYSQLIPAFIPRIRDKQDT